MMSTVCIWVAAAAVAAVGPGAGASLPAAGPDLDPDLHLDTILSRLYAASMAGHNQSSTCASTQKLVAVQYIRISHYIS